MKKPLVFALSMLLFVSCGGFAAREAPSPRRTETNGDKWISGRVIRVADGDTITIIDENKTQRRVRLATIDAPEVAQDFGQRSRQHLNELVYGKDVVIVSSKNDQYGRIVGKVMIGETDINLEQIRGGFAWHYRRHAGEQTADDRKLYAAAEARAKSERAGLWSDQNPTPPWQWRKERAGNEDDFNSPDDVRTEGSVF